MYVSRIFLSVCQILTASAVELEETQPGRDFAEHKISYPASCLASDSNLLAVGSWNTTISLYNYNEMGTYKSVGKMHGHAGGVTHMKFTPDGIRLVSGARKDHRLLVWDIRYYRRPLNILSRAVDSNQRIYFDISPCGRYLVSGGTDGILKVWDTDQVDWKSNIDVSDMNSDNCTFKFPLHRDCCNSVSIHPLRPILASGSGQYHFVDPTISLNEEVIIKNEEFVNKEVEDCMTTKISGNDMEISEKNMKYSPDLENSLIFWWIGEVPDLT